MQIQNRKNLGQYLYYLFKEKSEHTASVGEGKWNYQVPYLESYLLRDEYDLEAFAPTKGRNPLCQLDGRELCTFIGSLMESGRYDMILAELGCSLSDGALACIEMAERFCMVHTGNISGVREAQYLQYLIGHCGEQVLEHFVKVENMMNHEPPAKEESPGFLETELYIKKGAKYLQEGDIRRILLEGDFGRSIHDLTKLMTEPKPA